MQSTETYEYIARHRSFRVVQPVPGTLEENYHRDKASGLSPAFPYYGKIWPAAFAMSAYLDDNPEICSGLTVLELAGGLGLPSFVASQYARHVVCTDNQPEAVALVEQSITLNASGNIEARQMDWRYPDWSIPFELVLLSDINYQPEMFALLLAQLNAMLEKGKTVLISTPHRLMARPFVASLLPLARQQHITNTDGEDCSVLLLPGKTW